MAKSNKKGFTLAELLIVVAIIGVLVAIAIPVFSGQLEKAKMRTVAANARSAYEEQLAYALEHDTYDADGHLLIFKGPIEAAADGYEPITVTVPDEPTIEEGKGTTFTIGILSTAHGTGAERLAIPVYQNVRFLDGSPS